MGSEIIRDSEIKAIKRTLNILTWLFLIPIILHFIYIFVLVTLINVEYARSNLIPIWFDYVLLGLMVGFALNAIRALFLREQDAAYGILCEIWFRMFKIHQKSQYIRFIYRIVFGFIHIAIFFCISLFAFIFQMHIFVRVSSLILALLHIFVIRSYILEDLDKLVNPESALVDEDDEE